MHEMALVTDVVDAVVQVATAAGAGEVKAVYLTIGDGRDVVEEIFDDLFEHFTCNTVAEGAELVVDRTPYMVECRSCGRKYHIDVMDSATWPCPSCAASDYGLYSGMEFRIDRIEVA